jgi:hypothetical protein
VNHFIALNQKGAPALSFILLFSLAALLGPGAQPVAGAAPGSAAQIQEPQGKPLDSAQQNQGQGIQNSVVPEHDGAPLLLFNIRSAFSLSPSMVKLLQTRGEEKGEKPLEKPKDEVARSQAEPAASIAWTEPLARRLPVAAPLDLRLMGKNLIVIVQVLPIALRDPIVDIFVHGQIWLTTQDNSISYRTTMQTMSIPLGTKIYFYPLGADLKLGAPVAVEIRVDRATEK